MLRPVELSDVEELVGINDEEIRRNSTLAFPINRLQEEEWVRNLYKDEHSAVFAIVPKAGDKPIGTCELRSIDWVNRSAEFGIAITNKDFWDVGHGTEATGLTLRYGFEILNLNRISLHVYDYNSRAIHVYEKCGFQREGVLREARVLEGRSHDVIVMSVLSREYFESRSKCRTEQ